MQTTDYLGLFQNLIVILLITCPQWILCKGKKKDKITPIGSNESLMIKSGIKPPSVDAAQSVVANPDKKDEKGGGGSDGGAGASAANSTGGEDKGDKKGDKDDDKKEEKKDEKPKDEKENKIGQSLKPFPKFVMPTESARKRKEKDLEEDKNKKIKEGFYQAKSDEDDTLEKIESLKVEKSDKTTKNKKKEK